MGAFPALLVSLGLTALVSWLSARVTQPATESSWYRELRKPSWSPPSWLFGPAWGIMYGLMGVSAWLVWRQGGLLEQAVPLKLYLLQLVLNLLWSFIFFGVRRPYAAFVDILLLWAAVLATTLAFYGVDLLAGRLMLPYLLWVTFAAALNYTIAQLNA